MTNRPFSSADARHRAIICLQDWMRFWITGRVWSQPNIVEGYNVEDDQ